VHSLVLRVGDRHQLYLGGLGSAGYGWETVTTGEEGIVQLALESLPPPALSPSGGLPPRSFSVEQVLIVEAQAPGNTEVRVRLRRPWEQDTPALREVHLEISVLP
jgi:hypothetical protein